jgi:hypothetical protein
MTQADGDNSLLPVEVLTDLLGSEDFRAEVLDPEAATQIILQRLADAGVLYRAAGNNERRRDCRRHERNFEASRRG